MTFEQMKEVVKNYCNLPSNTADERIGQALNRHYKRVTSKCGLDATRPVTRTETTTNGVQTVTFEEIERIDRILNTTSGVDPLKEVSLDHLRENTPGTGAPRKWAKQATTARTFTIRLDTVPQDTYTLQADGLATLSDLTGTDEPAFPESFHDILTWSVIAEELLKKEKDRLALKYESKAEELLNELQQHYAESYSQVTKARNEEAQGGSTSGSGGGGTSLGSTAYTQTALVTFDRGTGNDPFAVAAGQTRVDNLNADQLDDEDGSFYLDRANHIGTMAATGLSVSVTDRLIGRDYAGAGSSEEIAVGGGLEFTGSQAIQRSALTGDVTAAAGSSATTIASGAVSNAKLATMTASTIKARKTASTGAPEDCTLSEVLDLIGSAAQGDILFRGSSGWQRKAAGTSGQFLQTLGASADPTWANAGAVDRDVAVATVASTSTETTVYSYAVPSNTLSTTRMLRVTLIGDQLQSFAGSDTLTIRGKFGATTFATAAMSVANDAARRLVRIIIEISARNATNDQASSMVVQLGGASSGVGTAATVTATAMGGSLMTEDTTAVKNLVITVQQQTSDANISFRCHTVQTELV